MQRKLSMIGAVLALAIGVAACAATGSVDSPVTEAEASAMAESMLAAYNDGDYSGWSADWSQTMKDAISEEAFLGFREQSLASAGRYVEISGVEMRPGENAGVVRWEFATQFENGPYTFMIAFNAGSELIEGVNLEPAA